MQPDGLTTVCLFFSQTTVKWGHTWIHMNCCLWFVKSFLTPQQLANCSMLPWIYLSIRLLLETAKNNLFYISNHRKYKSVNYSCRGLFVGSFKRIRGLNGLTRAQVPSEAWKDKWFQLLNPLCECINHLTIFSFLSSWMLEAVSALLHLSITVIWAPFPKIIIRWVAALCLECQLGSDVPKSINYAAQNMKSFNREADVTSLFRVFLPLQTWQSPLSPWSSAKMRRNCQRKLLTSCVPCDKVSQTLTGTVSVDSR